MNAATQTAQPQGAATLTLTPGYFARRNRWDWLFALLVVASGVFALMRYSAYMDVYELGILVGAMPAIIAFMLMNSGMKLLRTFCR